MNEVRVSITVAAPVEKAWRTYTGQYGSWYPKDRFLGAGPAETVVIEPYEGGRWFERQAPGQPQRAHLPFGTGRRVCVGRNFAGSGTGGPSVRGGGRRRTVVG